MVWEINDSNLNGLSDVLKQTLNPDAAQVNFIAPIRCLTLFNKFGREIFVKKGPFSFILTQKWDRGYQKGNQRTILKFQIFSEKQPSNT